MPRVQRREWLALAALLAGAAALRVAGAGYGLPYPLLDPDEGSIVPRAWAIGNGEGLDPGWYDYPNLLFWLLAPVQAAFDEPSYGAARVVAVAIGLAGVVAAWWLGRVAYGRGAALVAAAAVAVATTHVAYSRVAVTDVLLTLGITCSLALALSGRLEWAGAVAGLAASAKYPGVLLAAPLLVAGWGAWRRLGIAAIAATAAFVVTSPFVVWNAGAAWDDVSRVGRLARQGWLGFEDDPWTPFAFLDRAWETVGPLLVLGVAVLVLALVRRRRADLVLAAFAAAWFAHLLPLDAHFDRYVLPLVPVLAALAGSVRWLVPVALAALVVPLVWSIGDARELSGTDARLRADAWIAEHVPAGERIAAESSTLPLEGRPVTRLALPGPGRPTDPNRDVGRLRAQGVRWVLVSGAVADRVLDVRERYPRESAFYDELREEAALAFEADGGDTGLGGPWVRVYRLP